MKDIYKKIWESVDGSPKEERLKNRNDRVLIIDGLNTFIRSWTTSPNLNEDGDHIGGITGSLKSIGYVIRELNPTRVIIVFDGKDGSSKRKMVYEGYKSERGKNRFRVNRHYPDLMSEDEERESMKRQLVWLVDYLDVLPVKTMVYDGIEADDVIAYISQHLREQHEDSEQIITSSDKDFLQLVNDKTIIYSPTKKILYNIKVLEEEYGVHHKNFILYRILDGDTSDNIPGIRGCGLKTLIKRFPEITQEHITVERLFELAEEKRGKIQIYDTILDNKEQILMNEKLMRLDYPNIDTHQKLQILDRFNEDDPSLNKTKFMKIALKYKMMDNWGEFYVWLQDTFGKLVYE